MVSQILYNQVYKNKYYANFISEYYRKSIKCLNPINLIDGKTLCFGNSAIQELIKEIS